VEGRKDGKLGVVSIRPEMHRSTQPAMENRIGRVEAFERANVLTFFDGDQVMTVEG
jgi:hypothetical protein